MLTKNKTPIGVSPYVKAMLYYKGIHSCLAISKAFPEASHDCLTRLLNNEWMGQTLLTDTLNTLFSLRKGGFLQIDDTVIEKPYSKILPKADGPIPTKKEKSFSEFLSSFWSGMVKDSNTHCVSNCS